MDPPSAQLIGRLASLGLCTPRDLNKCRPRVKRLARDLPTFDSVWVDALVQARRLTPFQAQWLESTTPERLAAGPCVLVDRIGSDGRFTHYRGRLHENRQAVTVTAVDRETEAPTAAMERLRGVIQHLRDCGHPGLLTPSGCGPGETGILVISPWVESTSLRDLLVRRGRFAPDIVAGIGLQLAEGLSALEIRGMVHGDVRLRNVRLTNRGQSLIINTGLVPALWPELTIHADLPPDCFDAIAPELIGRGAAANSKTDMYALGCVLWEMLAGRPPYPHGDPLARLAAHQTQTVPDVRTWAPDTPEELAHLIASLTAREPDRRPTNFDEVQRRLGRSGRGGRRRLRAFHVSFRRPAGVPHPGPRRVLMRRTAATAGFLLLTLIGAGLLDTGTRNELLSIAASSSGGIRHGIPGLTGHSNPETEAVTTATSPTLPLIPFPTEIDHGVLTLNREGPYAAGEIAARGPLRIRGAPGTHPVILISDRPLRVWAEQLILDNVEFRRAPGSSRSSGPLAVIESQSLGVRQCTFVSAHDGGTAALTWTPLDDASSAPQRVLLSESLFIGSGTAIKAHGATGAFEVENALKVGAGPLLELNAGTAVHRPTTVLLRHVTLRNSGGVVRVIPAGEPGPQAWLTLEDCVLDIPAPSGALVEIVAESPPPGWQQRLRVTGENTLVRPETVIATLVPRHSGPVRELPTDQVSIDGLLSSEITFSGGETADPRDSVVTGQLGHGRSIQPPGIDARVFVNEVGPYNSAVLRSSSVPTRADAP